MIPTDSDATDVIGFEDLILLLRGIFLRNGASATVASVMAHNCASAERDAARSHGVFRMPGYVAALRGGRVDGAAMPAVERAGPSLLRVDAGGGFAQPALNAVTALAEDTARDAGACVVAIKHSCHFGALWLDVEPFAERGLLALTMVNSLPVVMPYGGRDAVFGTNPMAFAAPRRSGPPVVFDQAVSAMAHGDVQIAAREGRSLPDGTGVDREGNPTNDPQAVLDGALLPFGRHKGNSLALMIEIFAAALTGGQFSFEVDRSVDPRIRIPRTGQCLILVDPSKGGSLDAFGGRVDVLVAAVLAAGQDRMPGDRRRAARLRADAQGIPVRRETLAQLRALAEPDGNEGTGNA